MTHELVKFPCDSGPMIVIDASILEGVKDSD